MLIVVRKTYSAECVRMHQVVVGSTNPVKVAAVRAVILCRWPQCVVTGIAVASGVPAQPFGDEQTQAGARERARGAPIQSQHGRASYPHFPPPVREMKKS